MKLALSDIFSLTHISLQSYLYLHRMIECNFIDILSAASFHDGLPASKECLKVKAYVEVPSQSVAELKASLWLNRFSSLCFA